MENPEETLQILEEWGTRRARACGGGGALPRQLDEYLAHVARTGDPVFHWASVKPLIKEKLLSAVSEFHETAPGLDVPLAPNVDQFNYEAMRALLLERLDSFASAPFTVQRLCELLTEPRKLYNRIDKFMRAVEKNVLVVSTREPGPVRREVEEPIERALNGSDGNSDCGVDVDMEDSTWRVSRHPTIDPLAGVSDNPDTVRPGEISIAVPVMAAPVPEHSSPPVEEKADERLEKPEIKEDTTPQVETTLQIEKTDPAPTPKEPEETKPDPVEMDIDVAKEPAPETIEQPESSKLTETVEPISSPKSSEEDCNSNPEPQAQTSEEPKSEPVTSGEDSSSSNSSENTDGESERGGGDSASRSPERSAASEGDSSSDAPEQDGESNPKPETVETAPCKAPIQPEHYTVADIQTAPEPVVESPPVEPRASPPPPEKEPAPEVPVSEAAPAPAEEEPMQTDIIQEPVQAQPE